MVPARDINLCSQAKSAVESLKRHFRYGAYRAIRDPEGVIGLWAIEGRPNAPFSISFTDRGRVYINLEDVPDVFLVSFVKYVRETVR